VSTSIRDLLAAANDELDVTRAARRSMPGPVEALTAIAAAAPVLVRLRTDGVQAGLAGVRSHAVSALATATGTVATASRGLPDGRAAMLIGGVGDVVGTRRFELGSDDRWALALAVADTVRRASTLYRFAGPSVPNRHVEWSRRSAVVLARLGADHPPQVRDLIAQDRPVPDPTVGRAPTALAAAAQAVVNVAYLLRRSPGPMALYQLKATTMLAETTSRYLTAVAAVAGPNAGNTWERVPSAWGHVRHDIGIFHDGHTVSGDSRDQLLGWAARAHDSITRAFGPVDQITRGTVAALSSTDRTHLIAIAHELPTIATTLRVRLEGVEGRVFARIRDLPRQDRRITEQIHRLPVVADGPDFAAAHASLRRAELSSAGLATELPDRLVNTRLSAQHGVGSAGDQVGRALAARSARPERARLEPRREPSPAPGR
jgi:hypothetical protein